MALGEPVHDGQGWNLPLQVDVSGASAISTEPSTRTALVCKLTHHKVQGHTIQLALITTEAGKGPFTPKCPPACPGALPAGRCQVAYQDDKNVPVALGEIELPAR